jgi:tRNA (guanine-N7-)-methyltransferase
MRNKFLPSFSRQRIRGNSSTHKKFLKEEFVPKHLINLSKLPEDKEIIIEIGSGNGETALNFASLHPEVLYIACEVFSEGVIQTAGKIFAKQLKNVRFFMQDARLLLDEMPSNSIKKIFLFFPDPWPKARHHKRRIMNLDFLTLVNKKLTHDGMLFVATDHTLYKEYIAELGALQRIFTFAEISFPDWWVKTKYQSKALAEGRESSFYAFKK